MKQTALIVKNNIWRGYRKMLALLSLELTWLIGTTYLCVEHFQMEPLKDQLEKAEANFDDKYKRTEEIKEKSRILETRYEDIKKNISRPVLVAPSNKNEVIGSQINFKWKHNPSNSRQRYILEIRNLNNNKAYRFNAITPSSQSIYIPVDRIGYGNFLWRITPGYRVDKTNIIQGISSEFSLFSTYPTLWEKLLKTHVLEVGVNPTMVGKFNGVSADNQLVGFVIDLLRWVMGEISDQEGITPGIKLSLRNYSWNKLLPALQDRNIDIIATNMAATKKREADFDVIFSSGYFTPQDIIIAKNKPNIDFPLGLGGSRIGTVIASTSEVAANYLSKKYNFEVKSKYLSDAEVYQALELNEIDFALMGISVVGSEVKSSRFEQYGPPLNSILNSLYDRSYNHGNRRLAFALHRERSNILLNKINAVLTSKKGQAMIAILEEEWELPRPRETM